MKSARYIGGLLILFAVILDHGLIAEYISSDHSINTDFVYYLIWVVRISAFGFGITFIILSRHRAKVLKLLTFVSAILFTIVGFEIICQIFFPEFTMLGLRLVYAWPPEYQATFEIEGGMLPGISGTKFANANSKGFRGREIQQNDAKRIAVIGGSAAECLYLDQDETWPQIIENKLSKIYGQVWVGNLGRSGFDSRHHINQIKYLLSDRDSLDLIIVMVGINDLYSVLKHRGKYIDSVPRIEPFYKKTALWSLLLKMNNWVVAGRTSPREIENFTKARNVLKWRIFRVDDRVRFNALPRIDSALLDYRNHIDQIILAAKKKARNLLLLTQPAIYDSSGKFENLICFGGIGDYLEGSSRGYFDQKTLRIGLNKFNGITIESAKKFGVQYLDIAGELSRDTTVFYDDCHFNERGAAIVAELISAEILKRQLLEPQK